MTNHSVLIEINGWWVHPNWLKSAFDAVMKRSSQGKRPATLRTLRALRTPRIVEPTLAHLRATGR